MEPLKDIQARSLERADGHITDQEWCNQVHGKQWEDYVPELVDGRKIAFMAAMDAWVEMEERYRPNEHAHKNVLATPPSFFCPLPMSTPFTPGKLGEEKTVAAKSERGVTHVAG